MYSLEAFTVSCLSNKAQLNLKLDDCLPPMLAGDISKFRLALQSLAEFSMKYC
jgi:hypothetical protein